MSVNAHPKKKHTNDHTVKQMQIAKVDIWWFAMGK